MSKMFRNLFTLDISILQNQDFNTPQKSAKIKELRGGAKDWPLLNVALY